MGMTMSQKILASRAGLDSVEAGQLILCRLDHVHGNDITTPVAINEFDRTGRANVFDREKVTVILDHFVPNKDIPSAMQSKACREFCKAQNLPNFYDAGTMGIEHALIPEKGLVVTGDLAIGADSHTCTYGALGAFSTGVGSTDMAIGMATGKAWFKVPSAIKFVLKGKFPKYVSGKDLILSIIGKIGVEGALYKSMEFTGDGVAGLTMSDRFTVCNMAVEAGAKNGIFPVDDITLEYEREHAGREIRIFSADEDAVYDEVYEIDLSALRPTVAFPHLPENTRTIDEVGDIKIDEVVIGSCTNGRYKDLEEARDIIRGRHIAKNVRAIVIPATQDVYLQCLESGIIKDFIEAGCVVSTPTCGPCLGGYMGVLADGERAVSTTNRNFVGRMGDPRSEVYLSSPAVAAASAVAGKLADPEEVMGR